LCLLYFVGYFVRDFEIIYKRRDNNIFENSSTRGIAIFTIT
jgi:hypothetical protein